MIKSIQKMEDSENSRQDIEKEFRWLFRQLASYDLSTLYLYNSGLVSQTFTVFDAIEHRNPSITQEGMSPRPVNDTPVAFS